MSLEYCSRCKDHWNTSAGYHVCPDAGVLPPETPAVGFVKHDQEKPVYALLDPEFEAGTVRVLTKGSRKYADENWKLCKTPWRTYYSALRRHLEALARGEYLDAETQEPHWYHISCCTQFLAWFHRNGLLVDWPGNRSAGDSAREGTGGGGTGGGSIGEGTTEPRVGDAVDSGPPAGRPLPY